MNSENVISRTTESNRDINESLISSFSQLRKRYVFVFALLLNLLIINDLIRMVFASYAAFVNIFQYSTYGIVLLFSIGFFLFFKPEKSKFVISFFILVISFFIFVSAFFIGGISFFVSNYFPVLFSRIIPILILTLLIDSVSSKLLIEKVTKYRFLWIAYSIIGFIYISKNTASWGQYAGNFGFNLLLPFSLSFYKVLDNFKELYNKDSQTKKVIIKKAILKWLLYSTFFLLFIVLRGSRTAFLCAAVFVIFSLLFSGLVSKKNKKIILCLLLIFVIFIAILFEPITTFLAELFPSSRTIRLLSSGLSSDSGRGEISKIFKNGIFENPLAFRGLFSDRFFYSEQMHVPFDITNYPHNFFLEILFQFGLVIGPLLIILLLVLFIKTLLVLNKKNFQNNYLSFLFYFFFVSGVFRLISTSSYLTTFEFFAFIGISLKINILAKAKKNELFC